MIFRFNGTTEGFFIGGFPGPERDAGSLSGVPGIAISSIAQR